VRSWLVPGEAEELACSQLLAGRRWQSGVGHLSVFLLLLPLIMKNQIPRTEKYDIAYSLGKKLYLKGPSHQIRFAC
jgi:hypothetical protein